MNCEAAEREFVRWLDDGMKIMSMNGGKRKVNFFVAL